MAMETGFLSRHEHLQVAAHGQKRVTAVDRVLVFQENTIVRIVYSLFGELLQALREFSPLKMVGNSRAFVLQYRLPRRPIEAS